MTNVAVILSGCGHRDGAEIREAVLALTALSRGGAAVSIFAPDMPFAVSDPIKGTPTGETRNVLTESARIARGDIHPLSALKPEAFDALVIPGGFGVALNLSDFAVKGAQATVQPDFERVLKAFAAAKKPIGAICIAPAVLAVALGKTVHPTVTIGDDAGVAGAIEAAGATHQSARTDEAVVDDANRIVSTPAYMRDDPLHAIAAGIDALVGHVLRLAKHSSSQAAA